MGFGRQGRYVCMRVNTSSPYSTGRGALRRPPLSLVVCNLARPLSRPLVRGGLTEASGQLCFFPFPGTLLLQE